LTHPHDARLPGGPAARPRAAQRAEIGRDAGLELLALYGVQGIAAQLPPEHLETLMADPVRWPVCRELLLATCDHPNVVGVSSHLLAATARPRA
jgi:hypothetical protein